VFDNIVYGLVGTIWEHTSKEDQMAHVETAARTAFAHEFVCKLPEKYDTEIGQRGGLLSGGQKQRIAIARSIISQPKVLLLDEATSALDPHAEGIVQQALDKASVGRTTIVIAHKLATIRKADNIVVMSKGRIIEQGTHESLIAKNGTYARLVRTQQLTVPEDLVEGDSEKRSTIDGKADVHATQELIRYPTTDINRMDEQIRNENYDNHKQDGLFQVVYNLVTETPDLSIAYLATILGCVMSGECHPRLLVPFSDILYAAGLFPAQAILMSNMVNVYTLSPSDMISHGSFFAAMYVVLAGACLISYFLLGYGSNTVAQVRKCRSIFVRSFSTSVTAADLSHYRRHSPIACEGRSSLTRFGRTFSSLIGLRITLER
jgi:ATP-binding cassette subfamily B (MDR/TAP) protein 1